MRTSKQSAGVAPEDHAGEKTSNLTLKPSADIRIHINRTSVPQTDTDS